MSVAHPLSDSPPAPRRRNTVNYFTPKPESQPNESRKNPAALAVPSTEFGIRIEQGDSHDATNVNSGVGNETPMPRTPVFTLTDGDESPAGQIVLSTRWHTLSDQEIQANIATLSSVQSPSDESNHPYHDTIRILSAACERLVRQAASLERARRSLQQQEARRKKAAERAVKELKPGQRDTGQKLLAAIYGLEPTEAINSNTLHPKTPNTIPISLSEAMQEVWTPPAREQPTLRPTQPLDIPPSPNNIADASLSRSRASSFTPGSSIASHSIRSDKTGASKTFLGGWFGRPMSHASEQEDPDTDADVVSVASGNVSITAPGTSTAKLMSGVLRKGRNVFNAFGISPSPSPGSTSTPPREGTPQRRVEDLPDSDVRSVLSHPGSPTAKLSSLPFQPPLMSPVLPAVTTFSTKAPSIAALSLDSADPPAPPPEQPLPTALVHPAEYLKQHGHPAHLRAITLATRVMTADPKSILADRGMDTSDRVANGAVALVEGARRDSIVAYEPGRVGGKPEARKRSRSRGRGATPAPAAGDGENEPERPTATLASASLGRALAERDKALGEGSAKANAGGSISAKFKNFSPMAVAALSSPLLAAFPRSSTTSRQPPSTVPPSATSSTPGPANLATLPANTLKKPGRGTVELNSIVPVRLQPPTQFLSRAYTASRLTSPTFRPQLASRFTLDEAHVGTGEEGKSLKRLGMTDRYGFIYGASAYDVRLLQRARDASSTAPACLTGMKVQEQEDEETVVRDMSVAVEPEAPGEEQVDTDMDRSLTASEILEPAKSSSSSGKSRPSGKRSPTMNTLSRAAAPVTTTSSTGAIASPPSTSTVRALLDQLTSLHDTQQAAQKAEWDAFLKKRKQGGTLLGFMGAGDGDGESDEEKEWGLGMVGVGRMDGASGREFSRLVRGGVPLVYRDKVWSECAGATEMREPGVFKELLSSHEGVDSPILKEIEKDVVRTMPLNVFFGGDGMGVSKLRRVLQAYSWRNPEVGYCQGMNLIASTLLLVFPEEEDAFWVLVCVIETLLPSEFFSGSLIDSRACPLVLLDYVEIHHPKIYAHLLDMGVDLPAICFSWFLSMYTDCLPVETLFRVWDLFFAEGLDALFRVGLAIIRMNEAELLACDSAPALYQYLEGMTGRMWQADKLMKVESEIKGLMAHDDLVRRRDAHVAMLQSYA